MTTIRSGKSHPWKLTGRALALCLAAAFVLSGCATTGDGASGDLEIGDANAASDPAEGGFLGLGNDTGEAKSEQWMRDAPHSTALEPQNWLDYTAFYLGEIALMPLRAIQLVFDGM